MGREKGPFTLVKIFPTLREKGLHAREQLLIPAQTVYFGKAFPFIAMWKR